MNALRPGEICIGNHILRELLLEGSVGRVDARIGIVLTEYGHAGADWKRSRRNCGRYNNAWICRQIAAGSVKEAARETARRDRLLLDAIRGDRTDLRQHIL